MAFVRKTRILRLVVDHEIDLFARGSQAVLARALGVSESTISRDMQALFVGFPSHRCPTCGHRLLDDDAIDAIGDALDAIYAKEEDL
jgi:predicted DNA-binding transcriptional regulator YafY